MVGRFRGPELGVDRVIRIRFHRLLSHDEEHGYRAKPSSAAPMSDTPCTSGRFGLVASVVLGAAGLSVEVLNGFDSDLNRLNQTNQIAFMASAGGLACSMLAIRGAKIREWQSKRFSIGPLD